MRVIRRPTVVTNTRPAAQLIAPRGTPHSCDPLETHDRCIYQSARTRSGSPIPPLPLSEAQAWAEAEAYLKEQCQ